MHRWPYVILFVALGCASGVSPSAPSSPAREKPASPPAAPTETDEYTRYELLAPETAQFAIFYEVTAIAPGATVFFNPIRKGSVASNERVTDQMTGERLRFEQVSEEEARRSGLADAELDTDYIRIHLPRAVPSDGGQVRLLIEKTYKDAKSYFQQGEDIVFSRSLSIRRNSVVLPTGYELVACNVPSQVLSGPDGRIRISFMNPGPGEAPLELRARRIAR
ncbi:MAG TPA: hypothetical protein VJA66_15765 [Thermoanaerobaculia bacterium]